MIQSLSEQIQNFMLGIVKLLFGPADEFKSPAFLWLLLLIPAFLLWYNWWYVPRRLVVRLSYDPTALVKRRIDTSWMRVIPYLLQIAALFFLAIGMARPITAQEKEERYSEGIDIMLVMDASGSMETDDFKPSRLEVAKETAMKFIDGRLDDRIGIVLFAEDAFSYAPLTLDYELLKKQIKSINSDMMPKEGTAVGSAIAVAINRMQENKSPSQVIILLTDGASNRGQISPATAANLAKEKKIKIYSIGIGKEEYVRQTIFGSQKIKSDLDEASLKEISDLTGGQFFRSTNEKSLEEIFKSISSMEKVEIKEEHYREETDLYPAVVLVGFILLCVAFILAATFIHNPLEG